MPQRTLKHFSNFDRHSKAFFKTWHVLRNLEHFAKRSKHFATFFEKSFSRCFTLNAVPYPSRYLGYVVGWEGAKFPPFLMSAIFLSNAPVLLWHMHIFEKYRSLRRFALVLALGYGFWNDWEIVPPGNPRRLARFPVLLYSYYYLLIGCFSLREKRENCVYEKVSQF